MLLPAGAWRMGTWLAVLGLGAVGCLGQGALAQANPAVAHALEDQTHTDALAVPMPVAADTSFLPTAASLTPCPLSVEPTVACTISFSPSAPNPLPAALALDAEAVAPTLDLDPAIIDGSPTLQRWLQEIPDVADEIRHRPSFRTRLRAGYAQFPSTGQIGGFGAAVEDVFVVPGTGLTASADYSRSWNGQRETYGGEARYYLLPLGGYVNIAPTLGYRALSTAAYQTSGLDVGLRLMLVPSRGGGADLALSQRWVAPGSEDEVGITSLAIGYAVTRQLRVGTDFQLQNSRFGQDSRLGLLLELLL